jgi:hypothetical protein
VIYLVILELILVSLFSFQKSIIPNISDHYYDSSDEEPAYHQYFSHTIIDKNPYERISERLGITSLYLLNGLGILLLNLLSFLVFYCI